MKKKCVLFCFVSLFLVVSCNRIGVVWVDVPENVTLYIYEDESNKTEENYKHYPWEKSVATFHPNNPSTRKIKWIIEKESIITISEDNIARPLSIGETEIIAIPFDDDYEGDRDIIKVKLFPKN